MKNLLILCAFDASKLSRSRIDERLLMSKKSSIRFDNVFFLDCFTFTLLYYIFDFICVYDENSLLSLLSFTFLLRSKSSLVLFSSQLKSCTYCSQFESYIYCLTSKRVNRCFCSLHVIIFRTFYLTYFYQIVNLYSMFSIAHSIVYVFSRYSNVFENQYISI